MKSIAVGSGIVTLPVAPILDDGSAEALSALADYEIVCSIRALRAAGYEIHQRELTDYDSIIDDLDTFRVDFKDWISRLPGVPVEDDTESRGLPAVPDGGSWVSVKSKLLELAVAGGLGGVPAVLADIGIDVGVELFKQWLDDKVHPSEAGSLNEIAKIVKKAFIHDPGLLNLERSVFVGEFPGESTVAGKKMSIGQVLSETLLREPVGVEEGEYKNRLDDLLELLNKCSNWTVKADIGGQEVVVTSASITAPDLD